MERIVTAIEIPHLDRAHEYIRKLFSYGRCNRHNQPVAPLGLETGAQCALYKCTFQTGSKTLKPLELCPKTLNLIPMGRRSASPTPTERNRGNPSFGGIPANYTANLIDTLFFDML